jgi:subtilisin family serine protease
VPRTIRRALVAIAAAVLTLVFVPLASAMQPNDAFVGQSWQLSSDAPMGIQTAWDQTTNAGSVVVAVVDTGVDMSHPDLQGNFWTNPGEIPGNGIDDDHDGFVDDVHGADFVNHDGDPRDDNGHGTHVAGIIGAHGNNGIGSAGVAWNVQIMPVKVLDSNASGDASTVAAGVRYAVAHGAQIVNLSLAGPGRSQDLENAIAEAQARGVLVVCAAGNDHQNIGTSPEYPAALPEPNILAVAATAQGGGLSSVSNYGGNVKLAAPGESIISTAMGGGYELRTGTSMASPAVAGAAALVAAADGGAPGYAALSSALTGGASPTSLPVGGILNVAGALHQVIPASQWRGPAPATAPAGGSTGTAKAAKTSTATARKAKAASKKRKARACAASAKKRSRKGSAAARKRSARACTARRASARTAARRGRATARVARVGDERTVVYHAA